MNVERSDPQRGVSWSFERPMRFLVRLLLLAVIAALAYAQGYTGQSWLLLGIAVVWAASLPTLLRWLWGAVERLELEGWQRAGLFSLGALILIGAFVAVLRYFVFPV